MLRLHVTGPTENAYYAFASARVRIGSDPDNDIVLPADAGIRPRHAVFTVTGAQTVVESAGSGATLDFDGAPFERSALEPGMMVGLGAFAIELLPRDPPPEAEQRFLSSIARARSDDGLRAVYADWLEEQGRTDEATFLRAEIELGTTSPKEPRFHELARALEQLDRPLSHAWRCAVARSPRRRSRGSARWRDR